MKKNKMLRTASAMLILTIITTSIIGGALAKYTTEASATDTAVVAKFGVTATVSGDLFGTAYYAGPVAPDTTGNGIDEQPNDADTVKAATKVIAPGTQNIEGMTLSVTGTPEVTTEVTLTTEENSNSDIYLNPGTYGVMVKYVGDPTAANGDLYTYDATSNTYSKYVATPAADPATPTTTDEDYYQLQQEATVADGATYYPLVWYVGGTKVTAVTGKTKPDVVIEKLKETFKGKHTPGKSFDGTMTKTVGWEWPFDTEANDGANDGADTILGNMIAAVPNVVVLDPTTSKYVLVKYTSISVGESTINVAYTGTTPPTTSTEGTICACLTADFNASLKVEQVD